MRVFFLAYLSLTALLVIVLDQGDELKNSMARGKAVYEDFCVSCHLPTGKGVENTFPPLANSDYLMKNRTASIRGVKYGQRGELVVNGVTYNNTMMPMGLTDREIADVMNYVYNSWGNKNEKMVTETEVKSIGPR